jgi:hypothetical protein
VVPPPTSCTSGPPTADAIENEVPVEALRITLIANAFLKAEIDRLSAAVSSGLRGKV